MRDHVTYRRSCCAPSSFLPPWQLLVLGRSVPMLLLLRLLLLLLLPLFLLLLLLSL